jgi:hypothetical protein
MLHRGTGNGHFADPVDVYVGPVIHDSFAGDLNGDSKADLLFIEDSSDRLAFLAGNGDGTFAAPVFSSASIGQRFAIADLTGDDIADVAAFYATESGHGVLIFAGDGAGAFAEARRLPLTAAPYAIAAGDLDDDGAADLVIGYADLSYLDLLFGNDDGTFDSAVRKESGSWAAKIKLADIENDGDVDIVTVNAVAVDPFGIHRNRGGRLFDAVTFYPMSPPQPTEFRVNDIIAADVTGDGTLDLLVAGGNYLATLRGLGDALFDTPSFDHVYGSAFIVSSAIGAATDLDGDGRVDVLTLRNPAQVLTLLNHCGEVRVGLVARTPTISAGQDAVVAVSARGYSQTAASPPGTGTVTIVEGDTVLATGTLLSNGNASLTLSGLAPGEHTLVARYSGDDQFEPAQSPAIVQRVTSVTTTPPKPRRRGVRH